jgi:hypothetical protein
VGSNELLCRKRRWFGHRTWGRKIDYVEVIYCDVLFKENISEGGGHNKVA